MSLINGKVSLYYKDQSLEVVTGLWTVIQQWVIWENQV